MVRSIFVSVLSICVIFAAWFHHSTVEDQNSRATGQIRQSMVQRQHTEQRMKRLSDSVTHPILNSLGEERSAVQIRIAEFLTDRYADAGRTDNQLMYEQSVLVESLSAHQVAGASNTLINEVRILRLDFQVQLAHAQDFIRLLQGIKTEVRGWPTEVRACDMQRMPLQRLNVRCVVDIYHWAANVDDVSTDT